MGSRKGAAADLSKGSARGSLAHEICFSHPATAGYVARNLHSFRQQIVLETPDYACAGKVVMHVALGLDVEVRFTGVEVTQFATQLQIPDQRDV